MEKAASYKHLKQTHLTMINLENAKAFYEAAQINNQILQRKINRLKLNKCSKPANTNKHQWRIDFDQQINPLLRDGLQDLLMRPVAAGRETIRGSNIQKSILSQSIHCGP